MYFNIWINNSDVRLVNNLLNELFHLNLILKAGFFP
jgi:hypothetical protein